MNGNHQFYASLTEWTPWDEADVLKMRFVDRAALAKFITCAGLLVDLSLDQHTEVRKGVAANPYTPRATLKRLAEDDFCTSVQVTAKKTLSSFMEYNL